MGAGMSIAGDARVSHQSFGNPFCGMLVGLVLFPLALALLTWVALAGADVPPAVTGVAAADMDSLSAIASCWRSVIFAAGVAATAPVVAMRVVVVVVVVVVVEF